MANSLLAVHTPLTITRPVTRDGRRPRLMNSLSIRARVIEDDERDLVIVNVVIAAELFLSPHTIRSQMKSIYRKLGVNSRNQAVTRAREAGLLEG